MKIPCSMILDLLPTYIDDLCAEETAALVEEHLRSCDSCRAACEALKTPVEVDGVQKQKNIKSANPLKKIRKDQFYRVGFSVLLTFILVVSAMFAVQEVGFLHDFFFPKRTVGIRSHQEEAAWQQPFYTFTDDDFVMFDSIFWEKAVTNDAGVSAGDVTIRIKDADGNIVLDNVYLPLGVKVPLDLKRFEPYRVEILAAEGEYYLNFY
ncbi:MAG: zf-HC2 domain-containing protein [Eubacteriales bacterium]|nr:zf-HC2 domain-containing protein [Eubacteriales bacterium]